LKTRIRGWVSGRGRPVTVRIVWCGWITVHSRRNST
jgi:hypothetical protein